MAASQQDEFIRELARQLGRIAEELHRAIDDPSLAEVLSALGSVSEVKRRQLFAEYWQLTAEHRRFLPPESRGATPSARPVRRLGDSPRRRGSMTGETCPDVFELSDGSFAVIGTDRTEELDAFLPADAARADYERIVVITRETLLRAKRDIPDE